jgi:hypothetical protein
VAIPPSPDSVAEVPVSFDIGRYVTEADRSVPRGEDGTGIYHPFDPNNPDEKNFYKYQWTRTPLALQPTSGAIELRSTVSYWIRFYRLIHHWHAPIRKEEGSRSIGYRTVLEWNPDWTIRSQTSVIGNLPDRFAADLARYAPRVDEAMYRAASTLPTSAATLWSRVSAPVRLNDNPEAWLAVRPKTAYATRINARGTKLLSSFGLTSNPIVHFGSSPDVEPKPLPALVVRPTQDGIVRVNLEARLKYEESNKQLRQLIGRRYEAGAPVLLDATDFRRHSIQARGDFVPGRRFKPFVVIKDIEIDGGGNSALLTVRVTGIPFSGTIYFIGSLYYDTDKMLLSVENLDFKTSSNNLVFALASNWLLHGQFLRDLREHSRWHVAAEIDEATTRLQRGFGSVMPDSKLTINRLEPLAVYATDDEFRIAVRLVARVEPKESALQPWVHRAFLKRY